ncbi:MAG: MoaD/ThiS family protein [Thaumarchaeota archaeon]|nr:MoaD/ThiS family protein [Nitrososphaerota archaeon]
MRIKVKYFALLREILGVGEEEYELEDGVTLYDLLLNHIPERHRNAAEVWRDKIRRFLEGKSSSYIVIVNGNRADPDKRLRDEDVVAVLPPVGGG